MVLQTLDIKDNCKGIYLNGEFCLEPTRQQLMSANLAWKHSPILNGEEYRYLYLYLKGEALGDLTSHPEQYSMMIRKFEAHRKAAMTAKISLESECFFDLLPEHDINKWFSLRDTALRKIEQEFSAPPEYDILHKAHILTENIAQQDISFKKRIGRVKYDIFGSATGRLTTKKGSVPVLTLKKEERKELEPQNHAFVELDFNAAEIRMLLALEGKEQPEGDIHEWITDKVFNNRFTRQEVKVKVFSWLYNFSSPKSRLDEIFSRQIFRDFYLLEENKLTTPFSRELIVEERKAQNYLLQSTTSDQVLENAYKIHKMLQNKKSNIAFTLHDSIILDMSKEDAIMLREIKEQFESTRWGRFPSTCKIGKNFGELKELVL